MAEKHLSHAYMIIGPEGKERDDRTLHLASALLCPSTTPPCGHCRDCRKIQTGIHPDVIHIVRQMNEKGVLRAELTVGQIRSMTADAAVSPNEAERKVYIIPEADKMNIAGQNALLKALEEPPGHACFLLCATSETSLLPTVRSRCVCVRVTESGRTESPLSPLATGYLTAVASKNIASVTEFCMLRTKLSREETEAFLDEVSGALGDMMSLRRKNPGISREKLSALLALTAKLKEYHRRNISPKQLFGVLAAETLR